MREDGRGRRDQGGRGRGRRGGEEEERGGEGGEERGRGRGGEGEGREERGGGRGESEKGEEGKRGRGVGSITNVCISEVMSLSLTSPDLPDHNASSMPATHLKATDIEHQRQQSYAPTLEYTSTSPNGHSSSSTPTPSGESQKPPFGCGCGKCTFLTFIERGCPNPIPTASSFPYLDLSRLTDKEQQELLETLQFESQEIILRF